MRRPLILLTVALLAAVTLAGCRPEPEPDPSGTSPAPTAAASESGTPQETDAPGEDTPPGADEAPLTEQEAVAACEAAGATAQYRQPTFGTNNDRADWIPLGGAVVVCRFEQGSGESGSRLYVDPVTISSSAPTLAAIAYLSKTPAPDSGAANPATLLCDAVGGTSSYGNSLVGGGLVSFEDPVDTVVSACVFADGSFIDEWAIAYYSADTVRGTDLTTHFGFDPTEIPDIYSGAAG